jgi:hypothetical protein
MSFEFPPREIYVKNEYLFNKCKLKRRDKNIEAIIFNLLKVIALLNTNLTHQKIHEFTKLKYHNTLALTTLLRESKCLAMRGQDTTSNSTGEIKCMRRTLKYVWVGRKRNKDIIK